MRALEFPWDVVLVGELRVLLLGSVRKVYGCMHKHRYITYRFSLNKIGN